MGAILTQQASWNNVVPVIDDLEEEGLMSPEAMSKVSKESLEEIIRPCGFYRQKARYLKNLAGHFSEHYSSVDEFFSKEMEEARTELLALKGIGKETADSILLFAGRKPAFVAAAYVSRILDRTGIMDGQDYLEIQEFVESQLIRDPAVYSRLYAVLVELAKEHCLKDPECAGCPLEDRCSFGANP